MFTRINLKILWSICFATFVVIYSSGQNYEVSISDLDGTWSLAPKLSKDKPFAEQQFSWGLGRTIGESSFAIDLKMNYFFVPGGGLWKIIKISKIDALTIQVETVSLSDFEKKIPESKKYRIIWKFKFKNHDQFEINSQEFNGSEGNPYFKNDTPWYRLSGPIYRSY